MAEARSAWRHSLLSFSIYSSWWVAAPSDTTAASARASEALSDARCAVRAATSREGSSKPAHTKVSASKQKVSCRYSKTRCSSHCSAWSWLGVGVGLELGLGLG